MLPFDKVYVLNLRKQKERLKQFQSEMERIDAGPYEIFYALDGVAPFHSFCKSMHGILMRFVQTGADNCLILEDDAIFQNMNHLIWAMQELPLGWATLHLGANATAGVSRMAENPPYAYSKHLVRLRCAWTTQGVAYTRFIAESIVNSYNPDDKQMYDDWLSEHILSRNESFIIRPTIVWQRPGFSELWGTNTDYTPAWEATDKRLMAL
jgi:hypothetical protein